MCVCVLFNFNFALFVLYDWALRRLLKLVLLYASFILPQTYYFNVCFQFWEQKKKNTNKQTKKEEKRKTQPLNRTSLFPFFPCRELKCVNEWVFHKAYVRLCVHSTWQRTTNKHATLMHNMQHFMLLHFYFDFFYYFIFFCLNFFFLSVNMVLCGCSCSRTFCCCWFWWCFCLSFYCNMSFLITKCFEGKKILLLSICFYCLPEFCCYFWRICTATKHRFAFASTWIIKVL